MGKRAIPDPLLKSEFSTSARKMPFTQSYNPTANTVHNPICPRNGAELQTGAATLGKLSMWICFDVETLIKQVQTFAFVLQKSTHASTIVL